MILYLQIAVALIFFVNKVLVLVGRKSGWLVGAVAATLGLFYFYLIGLYIYTALEVCLIVLMSYAFLEKSERSARVETALRMGTTVMMIAIALFAFSGSLTAVELISCTGLLWGTYLMTSGSLTTGWALCGVAHVFASYLGYGRGQVVFADFQVASSIVSLIGATTKK